MPTHTKSFVKLYLLILIIVFCSCRSKCDSTVIKTLDEGLMASNFWINQSNNEILMLLEQKLAQPASQEKAAIFFPQAKKIASISNNLVENMEKIKQQQKFTEEDMNSLYEELKKFKEEIFSIDSAIRHQFTKNIILVSKSFDSIQSEKKDFYTVFFKNNPKETSKTVISKLQNNIRIIENKLLRFTNERSSVIIEDFGYIELPLVTQSSTIIKAGEKIEINAGVGRFSKAVKPVVKIDGRIIELDEMALAKYSFQSSKKPGKYYVPVEISYTDQDGIKRTIPKTVKYTVVEETKSQ